MLFIPDNLCVRSALLLGACAGLALPLSGAEQQQSVFPNTPVQSVVPKRNDKGADVPGKSYNALNPESSLGGVVDMPWLLQQQNNRGRGSPLSREKKEELDRKENWIFVTPDNEAYSIKKMLGVREEKKNALGEEKEFKSAMQAYVERSEKKEKGDAASDDDSKTKSDSGEARSDRPDRDDARDASSDRYRTAGGANEDHRSARGQSGDAQKSPSLLEPGSAASLFRVPGEYSGGASLYGDSSRFGGLPSFSARVEKTESQKAWATEFNQLLSSGGGSTASANSFGRGNDPVNGFADATRQPLNPVIGASPGLSRSPFDAVPRASMFPGATRPTGFPDSTPQFPGSPSLTPAFLAPPPAPMVPKPAVLELPKRKF